MRRHWRRVGAVVAVSATFVLGLAGVAVASTITTPTGNPFVVPGDVNGNPLSFTVVASGFAIGQLVYVEQCDGTPHTAPGWDVTINCDNGASNAPVIADASGVATFTSPGTREFDPVKGLQPTGGFACLAPNDPPSNPVPPGGDWTDCQLRVSTNNTAPTSDQAFLTLQMPDTPGLADTTPPVINSFTPNEGAFVSGAAVEATGDASDPGSGVATMTFTIDDGSVIAPVVDSTAPYGMTFDSTLLIDGSHTLNVTATDNSNNTTTIQTHHFTVDNTAPTITATAPGDGVFVHGTSAAITGNASDAGSGVASMSFTIDDGSVIAPIVDNSAPFAATFNSKLLPDGTHTVHVTATDMAGNTSAPQSHNFTVDNTAPAQPHFTVALAPFTAATTAGLSFVTTDAGSGVKSYQVQVAKAAFNAAALGPWAVAPGATALATTRYTMTGLAAGWDYCFRVIATDKASNVSVASRSACTARLIDDKSLAHSAGWVQGRSAAYYGGTYSTARSANRALAIAGFRGIRLAIKAVQCPGCGAIRVYVGTSLIKSLSLVSPVVKNTVIVLPAFSNRAGTIRIVTLSTRGVTIDAIGASRT